MVAAHLLLIGAGGCKAASRAPAPVQGNNVERPASGAQLGVEFLSPAKPGDLGFRFCRPGNKELGPQVVRIALGRVRPLDAGVVCEVIASDGTLLGAEWIVGTVPNGSRSSKCDALLPGEYELFVYGKVGDATRRLIMHADGTAEFARWDRHSPLPRPDECHP